MMPNPVLPCGEQCCSQIYGGGKQKHLIQALEEFYTISKDEMGTKYVGLDWDNGGRQVNLSMPGYIEKALQQF